MVSTPFLDEAERCHRLGFMAGGQLLAVDTPTGLLRRMPDAQVDIETPQRVNARKLLHQRREIRRVETVGSVLRVAFEPHLESLDEGRAFGVWLTEQGIPVVSCEPAPVTLGDVFSALSDSVETNA
jgi:ABC-2 type transport system ATP-binding protein